MNAIHVRRHIDSDLVNAVPELREFMGQEADIIVRADDKQKDEDPLETLRSDRPVPCPLGINHNPRPARADAKTAGLRAHGSHAGFLDALLHKIPEALAFARRAAVWSETNEDVPLRAGNAGFGKAVGEFAHGCER